MSRARARTALALGVLAAFVSCGREKVTALDLQIDPTGSVDQIEITSIVVAGEFVPFSNQETSFPIPPRLLTRNDVLTLWFPDSDDGKLVSVTVQGFRCGSPLAGTVPTLPQTLKKQSTVTASVTITAPDMPTCGPTGSGGRGGGGGASAGGGGGGASGGVAGTSAGGTGGAGGSSAGAGGGGAGAGGSSGATGTGGRGGSAGTGGTAGAGGGAAGAGGRGGSAGTGGAAGAGGRGGAGGGAGGACVTPSTRMVQVGRMTAATDPNWTCGYPFDVVSGHVATRQGTIPLYGTINSIDYANGPQCGRCIELTRTFTNGTPTRTIPFTVVGECGPNDQCGATGATTGRNQFMLSEQTFLQIGSQFEIVAGMDPAAETLTARDIPCPFVQNEPIYGTMHFNNGAADGVRFTGNRYPIQAVQLQQVPSGLTLMRDSTNLWRPPAGMLLNGSTWTFLITDINGRTVTTAGLISANNDQSTGVQNPACQ